MRYLFVAFLIVGVFVIPWIGTTFPDASEILSQVVIQVKNQVAAVIFSHRPVTVAELKSDFVQAAIPGRPKIRVLIVPGHEPEYGGAEFGKLKERDINVELSYDIVNLLKGDERFEVFVVRDDDSWSEIFERYFRTDWNNIIEWQKAHRTAIKELTRFGVYTEVPADVIHNDVPGPVATRLYGISKWSNENGIDLVIHVHFNDYPRSNWRGAGKYSGFSIYVPEKQLYNSSSTKALAEKVFDRLAKYNPVSDLPGESEGIIEDQELIALGAFNSLDAPSMLIEYSYLYEPQVVNSEVRNVFTKDLAYETYLGLLDFFEPGRTLEISRAYDTLNLPYTWTKNLTGENDSPVDVFALQTALMVSGFYPPEGMTLRNCPRTGRLGNCTKAALKEFKKAYGIVESLPAGELTLHKLNELFSSH